MDSPSVRELRRVRAAGAGSVRAGGGNSDVFASTNIEGLCRPETSHAFGAGSGSSTALQNLTLTADVHGGAIASSTDLCAMSFQNLKISSQAIIRVWHSADRRRVDGRHRLQQTTHIEEVRVYNRQVNPAGAKPSKRGPR